MTINGAQYSSIGNRAKNEDAVSMKGQNGSLLAIVADGLGGYAYGELASRLTVDTLNSMLLPEQPSKKLFAQAVSRVNSEIYAKQSEGARMMSTVAALWISADKALSAHVGDSRIYQMRGGRIIYQSEDHSAAQLAVASGQLRAEELRSYPKLNCLLRALGSDSEVQMDVDELELREGDSLLLCSDGLWGPVTEADMLDCLAQARSATQWLNMMEQLVDGTEGKLDNHTAVALLVRA